MLCSKIQLHLFFPPGSNNSFIDIPKHKNESNYVNCDVKPSSGKWT